MIGTGSSYKSNYHYHDTPIFQKSRYNEHILHQISFNTKMGPFKWILILLVNSLEKVVLVYKTIYLPSLSSSSSSSLSSSSSSLFSSTSSTSSSSSDSTPQIKHLFWIYNNNYKINKISIINLSFIYTDLQ